MRGARASVQTANSAWSQQRVNTQMQCPADVFRHAAQKPKMSARIPHFDTLTEWQLTGNYVATSQQIANAGFGLTTFGEYLLQLRSRPEYGRDFGLFPVICGAATKEFGGIITGRLLLAVGGRAKCYNALSRKLPFAAGGNSKACSAHTRRTKLGLQGGRLGACLLGYAPSVP